MCGDWEQQWFQGSCRAFEEQRLQVLELHEVKHNRFTQKRNYFQKLARKSLDPVTILDYSRGQEMGRHDFDLVNWFVLSV